MRLKRRFLPLWLACCLGIGCDREATPIAELDTVEPAAAAVLQPRDESYPWWRSVVFYEIFVRSFADSSSGPLADDGIGDLQGLIERLDYLNDGHPATPDDLEVGGLWLMPIMQSPSYHGYDVTDYRTVERDYGTNQDFRRLIREAHRRGIRVIVDLVLNHTSRRHPWFRDAWRQRSPFHDWYVWSYEPHDYVGPWGQLVWHEAPWWQRGWRHFNHMSYYGIFWAGMPDLDYSTPEVTQAMFAVSRFWLQEMGADGFRLDAIRHLIEDGAVQEDTPATHAWLRGYQNFLHGVAPQAVTVGEVWAETDVVATYGPDELDLTFQFALAREILNAVKQGDARRLVAESSAVSAAFASGRFATFLSNHDQARVQSVLDGRVDRAKLAATILLTGPGAPFLYYGEEIGMTGLKPDPLLRTPMQWTAGRHAGFSARRPWQEVNPDIATVNVNSQGRDPDSLLAHYRRLIRLRNRHAALRIGDFKVVATGNEQVYAAQRQAAEESMVVLINLGEDPVRDYALALSLCAVGSDEPPRELLHELTPAAVGAGDYRPLDELAPVTAYILHWTRSQDS
jgi:glycosidase